MKKSFIFIVGILIILLAIFLGVKFYNNNKYDKEIGEKIVKNEVIEDVKVSVKSDKIRLSPNCSFLFKTKYQKCGHVSNKYMNIPDELVNKTEEEIKKVYPEWNIEVFENNKVEFVKNEIGECDEHYLVKDEDGKIVIFKIKNGNKEEYQKTDISTEYITETDKITMKNGLEVCGKEELNQVIEDFE